MKADGPGDLLARVGDSNVFVEVRAIGVDKEFRRVEKFTNRVEEYLRWLEQQYGVYWEGQMPARCSDAEHQEWEQRAARGAEQAAWTGQPVQVAANDGSVLVVAPGLASVGSILVGPEIAGDQGWRLLRALLGKARQTKTSGMVWIWVEDHGALWPLTPFASLPLTQKVDLLAQYVADLFADHPHVCGIVVQTPGRDRTPRSHLDESVERPWGLGLLRNLPGGWTRETVIVTRRLIVPRQYQFVARLAAEEPGWLDWALAQLGVSGGFANLTVDNLEPLSARARGLILPAG